MSYVEFRTADTQIAAFLITIGHPLRRIDGPRGRREFIFDAAARASQFEYFADSRPVSPRKLSGHTETSRVPCSPSP